MELTSVRNILSHYYEESRVIRFSEHKKPTSREKVHSKNFSVLRNFLKSSENCLNEDDRINFRDSAESYLRQVNQKHPDQFEVMVSIESIIQHLENLKEDVCFPKTLSILNQYEYPKRFASSFLSLFGIRASH